MGDSNQEDHSNQEGNSNLEEDSNQEGDLNQEGDSGQEGDPSQESDSSQEDDSKRILERHKPHLGQVALGRKQITTATKLESSSTIVPNTWTNGR